MCHAKNECWPDTLISGQDTSSHMTQLLYMCDGKQECSCDISRSITPTVAPLREEVGHVTHMNGSRHRYDPGISHTLSHK